MLNLDLKSDIVPFTAINTTIITNYTVNCGVLANEILYTDITYRKMTIFFLMNNITP